MDGIINPMDMNFSKLGEIVKDREAWHAVVLGVTKNQTQLSNCTKLMNYISIKLVKINLYVFTLNASASN